MSRCRLEINALDPISRRSLGILAGEYGVSCGWRHDATSNRAVNVAGIVYRDHSIYEFYERGYPVKYSGAILKIGLRQRTKSIANDWSGRELSDHMELLP